MPQDPDRKTSHPSHPDQLMAQALGVCWHSPTSDRWPCTDVLCVAPEEPTHGPCVLPFHHLTPWHRDDAGTEWKPSDACNCCGHSEAQHGFADTCRIADCDCDAYEGPEAPYEPPATCGCNQDPIECNHEAALGEAEEKLNRARNLVAELEAKYGAHKGLRGVTGLLRTALGMTS